MTLSAPKPALTHSPPDDDDAYSQDSYTYSPGESTARPTDTHYFPSTNYFPPPPTAPVDANAPYPPYNPADYPAQNNYGPPGGYIHDDANMNPGNPYVRQDHRQDYHARRADENVSLPATRGASTRPAMGVCTD